MKMVIVQSEKKSAIALMDDGAFIKIPQRGYYVGQTVEALAAPKSFGRFSRTAIAAVIAVVLLCGSGVIAARMPYSYVTMDVNPSVKYTLNSFDRVLSVSAVNEDAVPIVEALNEEMINYEKLDDVIEMTITQCRSAGYLFDTAEDYVVLAVMSVSAEKTNTLADKLGGNSFGDGFISVKIVSSTIDKMKTAAQKGTTPGKLQLISEMQEKTGDQKPAEDWINVPVRDIIRVSRESDVKQVGSTNSNQPQQKEEQNNSSNKNFDKKNGSVPTNGSQSPVPDTEALNADSSSSVTQNAEKEQTKQSSQNNKENNNGANNTGGQASQQASNEASNNNSSDKEKSQTDQDITVEPKAPSEQEIPPGQELSEDKDTPLQQKEDDNKENPSKATDEKQQNPTEEDNASDTSSDNNNQSDDQQANKTSKN